MKQNCKATCGYCDGQTDYGESSYLPRFSSLLKAQLLFISEGQKNKKFICIQIIKIFPDLLQLHNKRKGKSLILKNQ